MKYFFDTEFIEDGRTIDLISIGMVSEDGRTFYKQNKECVFTKASDWVWRNVFPHLEHFNMTGERSCKQPQYATSETLKGCCSDLKCPWAYHWEIRDLVQLFCNIQKHGKPEFWGYYADYDWVAFCQLFGSMIELPKGFPMYCRDIKQLSDSLGVDELPKQKTVEHNSLSDALWTRESFVYLDHLKTK